MDWTDRTDLGPFRQTGLPTVRLIDGKKYFAFTRMAIEWVTSVIYDGFDGPAVFATTFEPYAPLSCALMGSVGRAGLAISGSVSGKDRPKELDAKALLGAAKWGAFGKPEIRFVNGSELGFVGSSAAVTGTLVGEHAGFVRTYSPLALHPFDLATLTPKLSLNGAAYPAAVPDGAIGINLDDHGLTLVRDDGTFTGWTLPESIAGASRIIGSVDFDQTTRDRLAWIECNSDGTQQVLWTAPYVSDPAKVVRTRLGSIVKPEAMTVGQFVLDDGVVLLTISSKQAAVYRVSDGAGWAIANEPGTEFVAPVWVDASEALISTRKPGELPSSVLRIRRDTLGAPTLKL